MTTKTVDQWAAAQCGVEIFPFPTDKIVFYHLYWSFKDTNYEYPWTIKDPRCCEIFRDWWLSGHSKRAVMFTKFGCLYLEPGNAPEGFNFNEIACITAIYEAEQ